MKIFDYIFNSRTETSGNFFLELRKKLQIKTQNHKLYKEAFTHSSVNLKNNSGDPINFERLEFLGDAILNSIIAEFLFRYYPTAKEGSLTKLRAKIVSRTKLNQIGKELELHAIAEIADHHKFFGENIHGNLLESLIGALFVDKGYEKTKTYVIYHIILPYVNMEGLDSLILSHKALLIEWSQKNKESIEFKTDKDLGNDAKVNYLCLLFFNKKCIAKANDSSKKKAEEKAAKIAVRVLKIKHNAQ